jgi:hypothetical protein
MGELAVGRFVSQSPQQQPKVAIKKWQKKERPNESPQKTNRVVGPIGY